MAEVSLCRTALPSSSPSSSERESLFSPSVQEALNGVNAGQDLTWERKSSLPRGLCVAMRQSQGERRTPPPPGNRERHLQYQQHHLPLVKEHVIPANSPFDSLHETPMMQEPREGSVVTLAHAHEGEPGRTCERTCSSTRAHITARCRFDAIVFTSSDRRGDAESLCKEIPPAGQLNVVFNFVSLEDIWIDNLQGKTK